MSVKGKAAEEPPKRWNAGGKVDHSIKDKQELYTRIEKEKRPKDQEGDIKDDLMSKDEEWNERLASWNKRDAYRSLAENVLQAQTLESKEGEAQKTLREAETAMSALERYMNENNLPEDDDGFRAALEKTNMYKNIVARKLHSTTPEKGHGDAAGVTSSNSGAAGRLSMLSSASPGISVMDVHRLKEEARARATERSLASFAQKHAAAAGDGGNGDVISERGRSNAQQANSNKKKAFDPDDISAYLTLNANSQQEQQQGGSGGRPKSAGSSKGGAAAPEFDASSLESVRRHNASKQKMADMQAQEERRIREAALFKARPLPTGPGSSAGHGGDGMPRATTAPAAGAGAGDGAVKSRYQATPATSSTIILPNHSSSFANGSSNGVGLGQFQTRTQEQRGNVRASLEASEIRAVAAASAGTSSVVDASLGHAPVQGAVQAPPKSAPASSRQQSQSQTNRQRLNSILATLKDGPDVSTDDDDDDDSDDDSGGAGASPDSSQFARYKYNGAGGSNACTPEAEYVPRSTAAAAANQSSPPPQQQQQMQEQWDALDDAIRHISSFRDEHNIPSAPPSLGASVDWGNVTTGFKVGGGNYEPDDDDDVLEASHAATGTGAGAGGNHYPPQAPETTPPRTRSGGVGIASGSGGERQPAGAIANVIARQERWEAKRQAKLNTLKTELELREEMLNARPAPEAVKAASVGREASWQQAKEESERLAELHYRKEEERVIKRQEQMLRKIEAVNERRSKREREQAMMKQQQQQQGSTRKRAGSRGKTRISTTPTSAVTGSALEEDGEYGVFGTHQQQQQQNANTFVPSASKRGILGLSGEFGDGDPNPNPNINPVSNNTNTSRSSRPRSAASTAGAGTSPSQYVPSSTTTTPPAAAAAVPDALELFLEGSVENVPGALGAAAPAASSAVPAAVGGRRQRTAAAAAARVGKGRSGRGSATTKRAATAPVPTPALQEHEKEGDAVDADDAWLDREVKRLQARSGRRGAGGNNTGATVDFSRPDPTEAHAYGTRATATATATTTTNSTTTTTSRGGKGAKVGVNNNNNNHNTNKGKTTATVGGTKSSSVKAGAASRTTAARGGGGGGGGTATWRAEDEKSLEQMRKDNEALSQQLRQIQAARMSAASGSGNHSHGSSGGVGGGTVEEEDSQLLFVSDSDEEEPPRVPAQPQQQQQEYVPSFGTPPTVAATPGNTSGSSRSSQQAGVGAAAASSTNRSLDVDDLEAILRGAGAQQQAVVPEEWPDACADDAPTTTATSATQQSPTREAAVVDVGCLSPSQKLSLLKRSVSRSPRKKSPATSPSRQYQQQGGGNYTPPGGNNNPQQPRDLASAFPTDFGSDSQHRAGETALGRRLAQRNEGRGVQRFERQDLPDPRGGYTSTHKNSRSGGSNNDISTAGRGPPNPTPYPAAAPEAANNSNSNATTNSSGRKVYDLSNELAAFFDPTSTADKGRYRVRDARDFVTDSMHRKSDLVHEGVTLLCGIRKESKGGSGGGGGNKEHEVITVLFDRAEFSEKSAREWWLHNKDRLL
jgi:hypothetical protein